jgi:hypothetical protein
MDAMAQLFDFQGLLVVVGGVPGEDNGLGDVHATKKVATVSDCFYLWIFRP